MKTINKQDIIFMKLALKEAKKGLGRTSPNPAVGAVIVKDGKVLAKGYHKAAGMPHAEIEALNKINGYAPGATLYVNLEPCNHYGKTPPCTEAIIKSGIKKVVIGVKDPNPKVKGGGSEFLKRYGIEVIEGVLAKECFNINEQFFKFIKTGLPFVVIKVAMTLDGWIATKTGHSKWITNDKSRRFVHRLRNISDAILVGIGTIIIDNPFLTTRLNNVKTKHPLRIIIDPYLKIPKDVNVLMNNPSNTLIIVGKGLVPKDKLRHFMENTGSYIIECPLKNKKLDLKRLMYMLGKKNIMYLLVEGGSKVIGSFIKEKLVDKFYIFKSPKILGSSDGVPMSYGKGPDSMNDAIKLKDLKIRRFNEDLLIEGYPCFNLS